MLVVPPRGTTTTFSAKEAVLADKRKLSAMINLFIIPSNGISNYDRHQLTRVFK
jgi:hypothetical protein